MVPDIIEFLKKTIKVWIIEIQFTSLHTVSCRNFTRGLDYEENKCGNPCQLTSFFSSISVIITYIDIQGIVFFLLYMTHLKYVRGKVPRYHKSVKNMIAGTAMTTLSIIKKFIARGLVSWRFHTASIKASHAKLNAQSSGALYIKETLVQFYIPYHMTSINQHHAAHIRHTSHSEEEGIRIIKLYIYVCFDRVLVAANRHLQFCKWKQCTRLGKFRTDQTTLLLFRTIVLWTAR